MYLPLARETARPTGFGAAGPRNSSLNIFSYYFAQHNIYYMYRNSWLSASKPTTLWFCCIMFPVMKKMSCILCHALWFLSILNSEFKKLRLVHSKKTDFTKILCSSMFSISYYDMSYFSNTEPRERSLLFISIHALFRSCI